MHQSEQVISARKVNEAPVGALLMAMTSASFMCQISPMAPATAMTTYIKSDIQAAGTCTNMMR